jgi:hypothetical protein
MLSLGKMKVAGVSRTLRGRKGAHRDRLRGKLAADLTLGRDLPKAPVRGYDRNDLHSNAK